MNRRLVILLVVILAILVVGGIGIGTWMMRENKSSKFSRDLLIISTNGGETYKIVENGKESYENNHGENGQNGEKRVRYIRTDKSILDQIQDGDDFNDKSRCDTYECKEVNMRVSGDVRWLLQNLYEDVRNRPVSDLQEMEGIQNPLNLYDIVNYNPVTFRYVSNGETIYQKLGNEEGNVPLVFGYMFILFTHKIEGKSLPRPDPSADYAVTIDM